MILKDDKENLQTEEKSGLQFRYQKPTSNFSKLTFAVISHFLLPKNISIWRIFPKELLDSTISIINFSHIQI